MSISAACPDPVSNPCVPPGVSVYAIGDIHGRLDLLDRLLDRIAADVARTRPRHLAVLFLGDIIDRGAESRGVVERLMAGPPPGPLAGAEWVCLKGNHEAVLLDFLVDVAAGPGWCACGGLDTVRSYLDAEPPAGWGTDMAAVRLLLLRHLPPRHRRFLAGLPLSHQIGDYLFVHAGVRPGIPLDDQHPADLLWIRRDFLDDGRWHGKMVVHGHTSADEPQVRSNRIGIDTRAYASGRLTALVLEGAGRRFIET